MARSWYLAIWFKLIELKINIELEAVQQRVRM